MHRLFRTLSNIYNGAFWPIRFDPIRTVWTPRWQREGYYKIGSVRPSVRLSVCPGVFLELEHSFFSKLWQVVLDRPGCFWEKVFGSKTGFFNSLRNFFWICSIMKIDIICCVPAQILYLGKILFLRYRRKCSQPITSQDF